MDNDIIDLSSVNLDTSYTKKTNFGGGIELLMNPDHPKHNYEDDTMDIGTDYLNELENNLNDLASSSADPLSNHFDSGLFGKPSVSFHDEPADIRIGNDINVGRFTASENPDQKTWDGYGKFNNIPVNPDYRMPSSSEPKLSKDDELKEKFKYLRKLEHLEKKGVSLTKKYNMDSNLQEMMGEYDMIMEEKSKQNSIKFQANMMMAVVNGLEFLNDRFDPFDVKLDGWGEQISENITDYDDVFGELYEKYKSKASIAPELKLLFQLGGSAIMVHMTNTMFKSSMPKMEDIFRQDPNLMRQFQTAAVNSMSNSNPGFAGFMNGVMNQGQLQSHSLPPPMPTQGPNGLQPPPNRGSNNNGGMNVGRADISMARGDEPPMPAQRSARRPDMKGPGDISDILAGLKTKTIEISRPPTTNAKKQSVVLDDDNSIISLDDLQSVQSASEQPKRSRRKPKSDKNTVSLDI